MGPSTAVGASPTGEARGFQGGVREDSALVRLILPGVVLTTAAFVRFHAIAHSSFWSDEGNSWALVQRSFGAIAAAAAADIHPPLYYWLLKLWAGLFGTGEVALRSFSAFCGVLLVAAVLALGKQVARPMVESARIWMPLGAAWGAAVLPFQVYFSQEARMYMLLALLAALLFLILLRQQPPVPAGRRTWPLLLGYAVVAAAGLWTHYSFPIVLAAAGLAWLVAWLRVRPLNWSGLGAFAVANAAALLLFAPWLPIAWRQITTWPQGGEEVGLLQGGGLLLHTLLFGVIRTTPQPEWPWLTAAGLLPLAGIWVLRRNPALPALLLWLGAPILLMAGLGLFSEAFLKFLLVASAPWCLLVAASAEGAPGRSRPFARAILAAGVLLLALLTLPAYYNDPLARDNYKGVAAWLAAAADPTQDLVLLNAPGQADVWALYDPGLPVLALPRQRPADVAEVAQTLETAVADRRSVYALLWATDEADPEGHVERWLGAHLYRGAERWQGNVRLAHFLHAPALTCRGLPPGTAPVDLAAACLPSTATSAPTVASGEPLPVALQWQAADQPAENLAASLQLLDGRTQVVAQVDAPLPPLTPGGQAEDRRALLSPAGTPPGAYRLIVVLYNPSTGERLPIGAPGSSDPAVADLGLVTITRPERPLPAALLPAAVTLQRQMGPVRLIGYTQHKAGFAHEPATPVAAGDLLHLSIFWQAPDPLPPDWPDDLSLTLRLGDQTVSLPIAGGAYATRLWQPGEIVRTEVDIPVTQSGEGARPVLEVAGEAVRLARVPR
jgi:4-amino-4-deoxy-L-arabinose transferase-like glycosyltransferase